MHPLHQYEQWAINERDLSKQKEPKRRTLTAKTYLCEDVIHALKDEEKALHVCSVQNVPMTRPSSFFPNRTLVKNRIAR